MPFKESVIDIFMLPIGPGQAFAIIVTWCNVSACLDFTSASPSQVPAAACITISNQFLSPLLFLFHNHSSFPFSLIFDQVLAAAFIKHSTHGNPFLKLKCFSPFLQFLPPALICDCLVAEIAVLMPATARETPIGSSADVTCPYEQR